MKKFSWFGMIGAIIGLVLFLSGCSVIDPLNADNPGSSGGSLVTVATEPILGLYGETIPIGVVWDTDIKLDLWTASGAGLTLAEVTNTAGEGTKSWQLTGTGSWMGMALRVEPITTLVNLAYYTNGSINFMYKGTKPVKVGIKSGGVVPFDKWMTMTNGSYGFLTNNTWCTVSIPLGFFREVSLDMTEQYFMVSMDSALGYTVGTTFNLDKIYYATNSTYAQPPLPTFNSNVVALFSETTPINVNWDVDAVMENWNDGTITVDTNSFAEGDQSWLFKGTGDWMGFGIRVNPATTYRNLANFTNGSLKFRFKGTLPVKIGIKSGTAAEAWLTPADLFKYGMLTNNTWSTVSIPLPLFTGVSFSTISYYFMIAADLSTKFSTTASYSFDDLYWTTNKTAIVSNTNAVDPDGAYSIFRETVALDVTWNSNVKMDIWTDHSGGMTVTDDLVTVGEGTKSWKLTGTGTWMGMGVRVEPITTLKNMSAYSNGSVRFMFKGTKPIKVGVKSGGVAPFDKWLVLTNGQYGFATNNTWCSVAIPAQFFREVSFDMMEQYFMVSMDSNQGYTVGTTFNLDNIYYATNSTYAQPPAPVVDNTKVVLFSETTPININWDVNTVMENWNAGTITVDTNSFAEGDQSWLFKGTGTWMGYGIRVNPAGTYRNLTTFTNGSLKFRFKGTRPVKIGIKSGASTEAWLVPAELMQMGMLTNNTWSTVSISMAWFKSKGIDFSAISYYFMMTADAMTLFSTAASYGIDDLYWTTNASAGGPVTTNTVATYGLFSETVPIDIAWGTSAKMDIWTDYGANMTVVEDIITVGEGNRSWKITGTGSWMGMGIRTEPITTLRNLSAYSNGSLNFMYKGTKPIKVGVKSGGAMPYDKWLTLTNGQYGFVTNNAWCNVSIPAGFFRGVSFDMIEQYFMFTSDASVGYTVGTTFNLDNIYFATNSTYAQPPLPVVDNTKVVLFSETNTVNVDWDVNVVMENWNAGVITLNTNIYAEGNKSWQFEGGDLKTWLGVGIRVNPATTYRNLATFANGSLKFRFKGTLPVKIGIKSGAATESWLTPADLMRLGMVTNNTWCQVSIPMTKFTGIDFAAISYYFMMSSDSNTLFTTAASYYIDDLYWTTNASAGGPTNINAALSYGLYSDTVPLDVVWNTSAILDIWNEFGGGLTVVEDYIDAPEGGKSWKLTGTGSWMGLSIRTEPIATLRDLSAYSNGSLNFMYKGTKPIKVGVKSGGVSPVSGWLTLTNGQYGFLTNNTWCQVSIPAQFFRSVSFDMMEQYFMFTSDASVGYTVGTVVRLDNIYLATTSPYAQPPAPVVDTSKVVLFSETNTMNVNWDVNVMMENWNAGVIAVDTNTYGEGSQSWKFTGTGTWMGYGIRVNPATTYRNLATFANGSMKFKFKGTQPVKIGIKSGAATESWLTPADLMRLGMVTNNTWCQVSIPMTKFTGIDFATISYYFMMSSDSNTLFTTAASYYIDDLYWTTNASAGGPTNINAALSYGLYSDTVPLDVVWNTSAILDIWNEFGGGLTVVEDYIDAPEGGKSWKLTGTGSWMGLSIRTEPIATLRDLSAYSNGSLNFMYKGTKPIKVGVKSGGVSPVSGWLTLTNGQYGFLTNNTWCQVSIPAQFFRSVSFDMMEQYFMFTSDASVGYTVGTVVRLDNIYLATTSPYAQPPAPVVDTSKVVLFSETNTMNVNWDVNVVMENWNAGVIAVDTNTYGEGSQSWKFTGTGTWMGYGIRVNPATTYRNLATFANGSLKFRFKGTRPVKIGIKSGAATETWLLPFELYSMGMVTNDTWCQVSIPMTKFTGIDFANISYYFMMASDAATLFSTAASYYIDDLYWTTNQTASGTTNIDAAKTYGLYSDTVPLDIIWNSNAAMDIWTDWSAGMTVTEDYVDVPEGSKSWIFTGTGTWMGTAIRVNPITTLKDMSTYSSGNLVFMYKGTKTFKVGIKSGGATPVEKWLTMTNGAYGFAVNNAWCTVNIPMSVFSGVNLAAIEQYFMFVADNTMGYTAGSVYRMDNIYWSKP